MRRVVTLTTFTFLLFPFVGTFAVGQEGPVPPRLVVTGKGELKTSPDQALLSLGVVRRADTAQFAQREINRAVTQIVEALINEGLEREDIQTSELSLRPLYARNGEPREEEPRIVGYEANYTLAVLVKELDKSGSLLDVALEQGSNRFLGIQFGLSNEEPLRLQALEQAIDVATQKAKTLADSAGVELERIIEIEEGSSTARPQVMQMRSSMMAEASSSSTDILAGQLSVSATVRLVYEIR